MTAIYIAPLRARLRFEDRPKVGDILPWLAQVYGPAYLAPCAERMTETSRSVIREVISAAYRHHLALEFTSATTISVRSTPRVEGLMPLCDGAWYEIVDSFGRSPVLAPYIDLNKSSIIVWATERRDTFALLQSLSLALHAALAPRGENAIN